MVGRKKVERRKEDSRYIQASRKVRGRVNKGSLMVEDRNKITLNMKLPM